MKTFLVTFLFVVTFWHEGRAQIPVTDVASITHNTLAHVEDIAKWTDSISKMSQQISQFNTVITQGKNLAAVVGNPKSALQSVSTVQGASQQFSKIFDSQTGANTQGLISQAQSLDRSVGQTMMVAGQPVARNPTLYDLYTTGDSLGQNLKTVLDENNTQQQQIAVNRQGILNEMAARQAAGTLTQTDLQKYQMALSALDQQQAASANVVMAAQARRAQEDADRKSIQDRQAIAEMEQSQADAQVVGTAIASTEAKTDAATIAAITPTAPAWSHNTVDQRIFQAPQ